MILDQIITESLEQLPESHVRKLAEEVVRLRKIETAAREAIKEAEQPSTTRWLEALASIEEALQ